MTIFPMFIGYHCINQKRDLIYNFKYYAEKITVKTEKRTEFNYRKIFFNDFVVARQGIQEHKRGRYFINVFVNLKNNFTRFEYIIFDSTLNRLIKS